MVVQKIYIYREVGVCVSDCARERENMRRKKGREINFIIQEEDETNKYIKLIFKLNLFKTENGNMFNIMRTY